MNSENEQANQPGETTKHAANVSSKKIWIRRGVEFTLILAIFFGVRAWQQRDIAKNVPPPPLQAELLDGKVFTLPSKMDKPLLVHFWATWCPICRTEQGSIDSLANSGYQVVTVAMQSGSPLEIQKFMHTEKIAFPVINDPEGKISAQWGVRAVPASFIIGKDGTIQYVEIGYTTELGLKLRLWLAGH